MLVSGKIFPTAHLDRHWQRRFLLALLIWLAFWPLGHGFKQPKAEPFLQGDMRDGDLSTLYQWGVM
jgi:hypothetical protein